MMGYPHHRETHCGHDEEAITIQAAYGLFETSIGYYGTKLELLVEKMNLAGFSPSEASRVQQSERMLTAFKL
jgi:hypothetical protein